MEACVLDSQPAVYFCRMRQSRFNIGCSSASTRGKQGFQHRVSHTVKRSLNQRRSGRGIQVCNPGCAIKVVFRTINNWYLLFAWELLEPYICTYRTRIGEPDGSAPAKVRVHPPGSTRQLPWKHIQKFVEEQLHMSPILPPSSTEISATSMDESKAHTVAALDACCTLEVHHIIPHPNN